MSQRLPNLFAIAALVAGGFIAAAASSAPTLQNVAAKSPAVAARPSASVSSSHPARDAVHHQMHALAHHARVNMVLYSGSFGQGQLAVTKATLDAVALAIK